MYNKNYGYDLDITELKHRIAYCDDSIVYDLMNGNCVVVNRNGWEVNVLGGMRIRLSSGIVKSYE